MPDVHKLTVISGSPGRAVLTFRDATGAALPLTGAEPLRVAVWPGDELAAVADAATAEHGPGAAGLVVVTVDPPTPLEPGRYSIRADVQLGGEWWPGWLASLVVLDAAGNAPPPPVYGSYQDLCDVAEWAAQQGPRQSATNWLSKRAEARSWLDSIILACAPGCRRADLWAGGCTTWGPLQGPNPYIVERLANGALVVDREVRRVVSHKAAELIALAKLGTHSANTPDPWPARADRHGRAAENGALCLVVALDLDADGVAELPVNLSRRSIR
jgi:hypothetical protein